MTTLNGDEPDLELGSSGEHVVQLQDRLRGMGLLDKFPDGTYDDQTETAVRQLQSSLGQTDDGKVTQETWQTLDQRMLEQGLHYNAYAGPGQQHWDQPADYGQQTTPHELAHIEQQAGGQHDAAQAEPYWDGEKWLMWDAQAQQWLPMQDTAAAAAEHPAAAQATAEHPAAASGGAAQPEHPEAPVIPHIDNIHPAIRDDERFSSFHDFLRETHGS